MLALLVFYALGSQLTSASTSVPKRIEQNTNACTLVVCAPAEQGVPGRDGRDGAPGLKGEKGEQGLQGPTGILGPPGNRGPTGPAGEKGTQGEKGSNGDPGERGPRGIRGLQGPPGNVGPSGAQGNRGQQGEKGLKGETGLKGATGPQGPQGNAGSPGPIGDKGAEGGKGSKGDPGPRGLEGPAGPQGPVGNPGPSGSKGDKGSMGEKGMTGDSALSEVNLLKKQVSALEAQLKVLQVILVKYQKVALFPNGLSVGNKVFMTNGHEGNFNDLQLICQQAGGQLASPRNAAENAAIQQFAVVHNKAVFLGVTDIQTEGRFKYLNGEPITYSNWLQGEPNNLQGNENCVEVFVNGKWNDRACGEKRLLLCEF